LNNIYLINSIENEILEMEIEIRPNVKGE